MTAITTAAANPDMDRFPVILAAATLFSIAVMPGAVTPGIVGAAAEAFQWPESRLGIFAGMFFAGFGLSGASAYLWIREVNWRVTCSLGIVLMGITFALMGITENYRVMVSLMFFNGLSSGIFASPSITMLGDGSRPETGFSTMIIVSVSSAAILLALFPWVGETAGFAGIVYLMCGTTLLTLLLIPVIPAGNKPAKKPAARQTDSNGTDKSLISQPLLAHLVMVTFTMGFGGAWTFFERIAHYAELSPTATGYALAIGTLFGAIGAPLAAWFRRRIPMYYSYGITILFLVFTLLVLGWVTLTDMIYLVLVCSFQFWINAGFCLIMALTAEADKVGRFVALIPASESLGSVIGPVVCGFALEFWGVTALVVVTAAVFLIGAGVFTFVDCKDRALMEKRT
ncbi:MAG: MFS transporter [Gammaproteobacteria bacterium]|nr:MFS transporter [Gammaproteobacteria bacterium]